MIALLAGGAEGYAAEVEGAGLFIVLGLELHERLLRRLQFRAEGLDLGYGTGRLAEGFKIGLTSGE